MTRNRFFVGLFLLTIVRAQDVPPPPKPADSGPSLEATMKFIAEKLDSSGPVNSINYFHDNSNQRPDWTGRHGVEVSKVRATAADRRIDYREQYLNVAEAEPRDIWFVLKDVEEVVVKPFAQALQEGQARGGNPEYTVQVEPPLFQLTIQRKRPDRGKKASSRTLIRFYLYDEALANRLAKAMAHAAELCGGTKDPF